MQIRLKEAAKDGFSLEMLNQIGSFANRIKYCTEMLGAPIGNGSARTVYQIDDDKVLKLAKNRKGIAQNEAEADWNMQNYGVVPILYEVDSDDYLWIVTEFVLQAKLEDFPKVLGIDFDDFKEVVIAIYNQYARRPIKCGIDWNQFEEIMENNEWLYNLNTFMSDYQLPFGDIVRIQNLGLCNRDGNAEIVILDNGLNDEVYRNYYSR